MRVWTVMRAWTVLAILGLAWACESSTTDTGPEARPEPGWLELRLTSPFGDDGALLLTVRGAAVDSFRAHGQGAHASVHRSAPLVTRLLVADDFEGGAVGSIRVPDVGDVGAYTVVVDQAAARATFEQRSVDGYRVSVTR